MCMKKKAVFQVKNKNDIKKLVLATQKRVFSHTVVPKVLINDNFDIFQKNSNNTMLICKIIASIKNFKNYVHKNRYDVGLYFFTENKKNYCIIIDGNGTLACRSTISIFENILGLSENNIIQEKHQIQQKYKELKKQNLLFDNLI